jgi:hypothetical protein
MEAMGPPGLGLELELELELAVAMTKQLGRVAQTQSYWTWARLEKLDSVRESAPE